MIHEAWHVAFIWRVDDFVGGESHEVMALHPPPPHPNFFHLNSPSVFHSLGHSYDS